MSQIFRICEGTIRQADGAACFFALRDVNKERHPSRRQQLAPAIYTKRKKMLMSRAQSSEGQNSLPCVATSSKRCEAWNQKSRIVSDPAFFNR
jgi:hypothetical protein